MPNQPLVIADRLKLKLQQQRFLSELLAFPPRCAALCLSSSSQLFLRMRRQTKPHKRSLSRSMSSCCLRIHNGLDDTSFVQQHVPRFSWPAAPAPAAEAIHPACRLLRQLIVRSDRILALPQRSIKLLKRFELLIHLLIRPARLKERFHLLR